MTSFPKKEKHRKYVFKRAARACEQCKKSKTRCNYVNNGRSCFRCMNMGLDCSLNHTELTRSDFANMVVGKFNAKDEDPKMESDSTPDFSDDEVKKLRADIREVLKRLQPPGSSLVSILDSERPAHNAVSTVPSITPSSSLAVASSSSAPILDKMYFDVTPFRDAKSTGAFYGLPFTHELAYGIVPNKASKSMDIIDIGFVNYDTACVLVKNFNVHYGRWTSFDPSLDPKTLLDTIREDSPALVSVMCLMGSRHYPRQPDTFYLAILNQLQEQISGNVNLLPQPKKLLQSLVILSTFAMTLSYKTTYFDAWHLSGYALLHYITREMDLNLLSERFKTHPDRLNSFRLWNHLSLVHLVNCILSGRPCLIDELRLDQCREILDIPAASTSDGVIVAQISLTLVLYNSLQFEEPLETSLKELESSWQDWEYLWTQPPSGNIIGIVYRFARIMIYRRQFLKIFDSRRNPIPDAVLHTEEEEKYIDNLKRTVIPMIEECILLIELADNIDISEITSSGDWFRYFIFYAAMQMLRVIRLGFGSKWISMERVHRVEKGAKAAEELISDLVESVTFYSDMPRAFSVMLSKMNESIHEQEL